MGVKGPKNCTFTLNSVNLTAYVDQVDLNMAVAELETTNLDSSAQEFIPGLPSYDASIAVTKWDKVVDDVLGPLALTPAKVTAAHRLHRRQRGYRHLHVDKPGVCDGLQPERAGDGEDYERAEGAL
jgi:hypothetical protein